jgi:hypothetical protein
VSTHSSTREYPQRQPLQPTSLASYSYLKHFCHLCCSVTCRQRTRAFSLACWLTLAAATASCTAAACRNIVRFLGLGCFAHGSLAEVRESMFMVEEYVGDRTVRKVIR